MQQIRFDDGEAYEQGMSPWSRLAGEVFLAWLAPASGWRWLDVGCGTGTFTELIAMRCSPGEVQGIDPSEGQLAFARSRPGAPAATFRAADAMDLPFAQHRFDAAIMALVIFFVPKPERGLSEMLRVVRPGGCIGAYAWDVLGGGFPFDPVWQATREAGVLPLLPPRPELGRKDALRDLWMSGGLDDVEVREISVTRTFPSFDDYWATSTITGGVRPVLDAMSGVQRSRLKDRVRELVPAGPAGRVAWTARAHAVKGRVPQR